MPEIIDYDPMTGMTMKFDYVPETDTTILSYHQDYDALQAIADRNAEERTEKKSIKGDYLDHYARIPLNVIYEWLFKYGVDYNNRDHQERWMAMLEWPEYKWCKTTERKLV